MATRIDSPSNPRIVASLKAVATHEKMLLEGRRMIEEALDAEVAIEEIFVLGNRNHEKEEQEEDLLRRVRGEGSRVMEVSPKVIRKLSELPSTRGVVAIAAPPRHDLNFLSDFYSRRADVKGQRPLRGTRSAPSTSAVREKDSHLPAAASAAAAYERKSSSPIFLLLDDVQDPANVGAILRSGEAFGVAGAVLTPGCAWPFSPRALRASGGSAFRLPVAARVAAREAVAWARRHGIALAGAAAHGGAAPEVLAGLRPLALVIGSEGHGISAEVAGSLDHRVTLPLAGRVESLNAAVAAGVLLHILSRPPESAR